MSLVWVNLRVYKEIRVGRPIDKNIDVNLVWYYQLANAIFLEETTNGKKLKNKSKAGIDRC